MNDKGIIAERNNSYNVRITGRNTKLRALRELPAVRRNEDGSYDRTVFPEGSILYANSDMNAGFNGITTVAHSDDPELEGFRYHGGTGALENLSQANSRNHRR